MGKSICKRAIFKSYVKFPEGSKWKAQILSQSSAQRIFRASRCEIPRGTYSSAKSFQLWVWGRSLTTMCLQWHCHLDPHRPCERTGKNHRRSCQLRMARVAVAVSSTVLALQWNPDPFKAWAGLSTGHLLRFANSKIMFCSRYIIIFIIYKWAISIATVK